MFPRRFNPVQSIMDQMDQKAERSRQEIWSGEGPLTGLDYEFGTSSGRQGTFNPDDPTQSQLAQKRLQFLKRAYQERLNPGYTGETGLMRSDIDGYVKLQNARTEAQNIQRILSGQGPLQVRFGGMVRESPEKSAVEALRRTNAFKVHEPWSLG